MTDAEKDAIRNAIKQASPLPTWNERKQVLSLLPAWKHFIGHEVGHAVAAIALGGVVKWVSVDPVFLKNERVDLSKTPAQCRMDGFANNEDMFTAGMAGEQGDRVFTKTDAPFGVERDVEKIKTAVGDSLVDVPCSRPDFDSLSEGVSKIAIAKATIAAGALFKHPSIIEAVRKAAAELKEKGTLTGDELKQIIASEITDWQSNP